LGIGIEWALAAGSEGRARENLVLPGPLETGRTTSEDGRMKALVLLLALIPAVAAALCPATKVSAFALVIV
jgi:hypothetical protein